MSGKLLLAIGLASFASLAQAKSTCTAPFRALLNQIKFTPVSMVTLPAVNVPSEAEIGAIILTAKAIRVYRDYIAVSQSIEYRGTDRRGPFTIQIPAGQIFIESTDAQGGYYVSEHGTMRYDKDGAIKRNLKVGIKLPVGDVGQTGVFYWNGRSSVEHFQTPLSGIKSVTCILTDDSYLQRELLYSGTSQNAVTLSYRELKNGLLRPAFSQELKFDLSQGREVGFRGARIRILEANNTLIRYEVLKPLE